MGYLQNLGFIWIEIFPPKPNDLKIGSKQLQRLAFKCRRHNLLDCLLQIQPINRLAIHNSEKVHKSPYDKCSIKFFERRPT